MRREKLLGNNRGKIVCKERTSIAENYGMALREAI